LEHDWVAGWALWAGIDYIGETSRFNLKGWPTGVLDTGGREKTIAGLYRAFWKDEPQLKIAVLDEALDIDPGPLNWSSPKMISHWNFPHYRNQLIRVHTFSNCDTVELHINRRSLGKRAVGVWNNQTVAWMVPYADGVLRATGYKNGKAVITEELRTAGTPAKIVLKSLFPYVNADGQDVALIEISMVDSDGLPVQHDDRKLSVSVEGAGIFVGLDNGDLRMREPIRLKQLSTWFGQCLLVVQSKQVAGDIFVIVKGEGLPDATLTIKSLKI
jgi:beta-galactosidase